MGDENEPLRPRVEAPPSSGSARVTIDTQRQGRERVDPKLLGKFGEHLYSTHNAKNTLEAQVLHNPTFGSWKFQVPSPTVDGGRPPEHGEEEVRERVERYAAVRDFPDADRMLEAYRSGTALWWFPTGDRDAVRTSPDVGVADDRAQRVEIDSDTDADVGLAQWCYLPLHRTTGFEGTVTARATEEVGIRVGIHAVTDDGALREPIDEQRLSIDTEWTTASFELELGGGYDADALYAVSIRPEPGANLVLDTIRLYPDDHVATADPEVVAFLREADLPLLRWPGGNFVSGYHWEDAIGPIEERPTRPNPAWDGLEPNFFGTVEFLEFCEAVGCEPMICLNAGNGTAQEAANWVEYCNGDTDTEYGALRAEHGHEEPFDVTYWEVGNEVYGPWQTTWTTPRGYSDRYGRFEAAMRAVDDSIEVFACGNRLGDWNDPVVADHPEAIDWITDHVLVGGTVGTTDPAALYNGLMTLAEQVGHEYAGVIADMATAGVSDPKVAITELQLFVSDDEESPPRDELPTNDTVAEAVYDATFLHEAIRSDGDVGMITHSGTGNHGGGLKKSRERVRADPCYYVHRAATTLVDGLPVGVDVACPTYDSEATYGASTGEFFGQLRPREDVPAIDVAAVTHTGGLDAGDTDRGPTDDTDLVVSLAHRDATGDALDIRLDIDEDDAAIVGEATVTRVGADAMTARNTPEEPERVTDETERVESRDGGVEFELAPFTVAIVEATLA